MENVLGDVAAIRQAITRAIVTALAVDGGYHWTVAEEDRDHAKLTTTGDAERAKVLHLFYSRSDNRIEISGGYPWRKGPDGSTEAPAMPYKAVQPRITVALDKAPELIARDIKRRLLPAYEALLTQVLERHANANDHEAKTANVAQRIADATGGKLNPNLWWPFPQAGGYIWKADVSGASVNVDVRGVSADVAIQIINLVHGRP